MARRRVPPSTGRSRPSPGRLPRRTVFSAACAPPRRVAWDGRRFRVRSSLAFLLQLAARLVLPLAGGDEVLGDAVAARPADGLAVIGDDADDVVGKQVEARHPAPAVAVALLDGEERRLPEMHQRHAADVLEIEADDGLVPVEVVDVGEDQPARLVDLEVLAPDV